MQITPKNTHLHLKIRILFIIFLFLGSEGGAMAQCLPPPYASGWNQGCGALVKMKWLRISLFL